MTVNIIRLDPVDETPEGIGVYEIIDFKNEKYRFVKVEEHQREIKKLQDKYNKVFEEFCHLSGKVKAQEMEKKESLRK